jgi:cell filamentation protein
MSDVHRRIVAANRFEGLSAEAFARAAGEIMGDVNYVHPFREGNGRAQLFYLKQLSHAAGHVLDLRHIDAGAWIEASRRATLIATAFIEKIARVFEIPLSSSRSAALRSSAVRMASPRGT